VVKSTAATLAALSKTWPSRWPYSIRRMFPARVYLLTVVAVPARA
jgi:hypothetical protein